MKALTTFSTLLTFALFYKELTGIGVVTAVLSLYGWIDILRTSTK
jgi:hypothetical protein